MRSPLLCSVLLLLCSLQTSCIFTSLVASGVAATADPRIELVERRGEFEAHYLGVEALDGVEHFAFAIPGLLEDREPDQVFTLYIPDSPATATKPTLRRLHNQEIAAAQVRQTLRADLADHPTVSVRVLAGTGSARKAEGEDAPERPTGIRLYTKDESYGVNLYYSLHGRQFVRPVSIVVPYEERSGFFTGLQKSLYFITIPLDIALSPVVIPVLFGIAFIAS